MPTSNPASCYNPSPADPLPYNKPATPAGLLVYSLQTGVQQPVKVGCAVPFRQAAFTAVDQPSALHGRAFGNLRLPAQQVAVVAGLQKLHRAIHIATGHSAIPGPDGNIGNTVVTA